MHAALLALAVSGWMVSATGVPPPKGLEAALVKDAQAGQLRTMGLLDAALIASGVPDEEVAANRERVLALLKPVAGRAALKKEPAARGRALLEGLHAQVFRQYAAGQSNVWDAANTGVYNCVSSAVLFLVAAEGLLDQPRAMLMPTHAYARVTVKGVNVDVETTTAQGFGMDRKEALSPEFLAKLGVRPDKNGKLPDLASVEKMATELPPLALVASVYSNRAVDLMEKGDRQGAAVALDRGMRLATGEHRTRLAQWRGTMLANAGADLVEQERYRDAIPLLQAGLEGSSGDVRTSLLHNLGVAHIRLGQLLEKRGAFSDAAAVLEDALRQGLTGADIKHERDRLVAKAAAVSGESSQCAKLAAPAAAECHAQIALEHLRQKRVQPAVDEGRRAVALDATVKNVRVAMWNALHARAQAAEKDGQCLGAEADFTSAEAYRDVAANDPVTLAQKVAGCWSILGESLAAAGKSKEAEAALTRAFVSTPKDTNVRQNLAAIRFNRALTFSNAGSCDEARPLALSAVNIQPDVKPEVERLLAACAAARANAPWDKHDWVGAAQELRRGLKDAPTNTALKGNLATALYNLAVTRANAGECEEAASLVDEALALGLKADVAPLRKRCG